MSSLGRLKAQRALAVRHHGKDSPQAREAAAKLAAGKTTVHLKRLLDEATELTDEQRTKLAELLLPARQAITKARLAELGDGDVA